MKKLTLSFLLLLSIISINMIHTNAESVQTDQFGYEYYEKLDIVQIEAGLYHNIMLTSDGRVFTWGRNNNGQLGDGTIVDKTTPVEITGNFPLNTDEYIVTIEADGDNGMVLTNEGRAFQWGDNFYEQLGNGSSTDSSLPIPVYATLAPGETIIDLALGGRNAGIVTSNNRVLTWGDGYYHANAFGSNFDLSTPTDVTSNFTLAPGEVIEEIDLGVKNGIALSNMGVLYGWGNDEDQAVGASGSGPYAVPVSLMNMFMLNPGESFEYINATLYNTTAITTEGRMYKCGSNVYKSVKIHDHTSLPWIEENLEMTLNPGEYFVLENGGYSSLTLTSDNRVFSWGYNNVGQLSSKSVLNHMVFEVSNNIPLQNGEEIIDIAVGFVHTVFLTDQGRLYTIGSNNYGQIGDSGASAFVGPKEMSTDFSTYTISDFTYPGTSPSTVDTIIDMDGDKELYSTADFIEVIIYPEYNLFPHLLSINVDGTTINVGDLSNIGGRIIANVPNVYGLGDVDISLNGFTLSDGTYVETDGNHKHTVTFIFDTTPPSFTVTDQTAEGGIDQFIDWTGVAENITDNAGGSFLVVQSVDYDLETFTDGTVTLTVTDESGNSSQETFNVDVVDTTPPTFTLPETIILESGTMLDYDWSEMVTDLEDVGRTLLDITVIELSDPIDYDHPTIESYDVTVKATDPAGNSTTNTIEVFVEDSTEPIFNHIPDQTINVSDTNIDWTTYIVDETDLSSSILIKEEFDLVVYGTTGTYEVTVTLQDESLNVYTQTFDVDVIDSELPVIEYDGVTSIEVNTVSINFLDHITVTDNYDIDLESITELLGTVSFDTVGVYQIEFSVTDSSLNEGTLTVDIHIVDTTLPVITLIGDDSITIEYGDTYTDEGVTCEDNYDNDCDLVIVNSIDFEEAGTYTITYNTTDQSGNDALEVIRTITINEPDIPVVTLLPGIDTIYVGNYHHDASVDIDEDMYDTFPTLYVTSTVDTDVAGTYLITYVVTNEVGIQTTILRYVTVLELQPIVVFDIEQGITSIRLNGTFNIPDCTVMIDDTEGVCQSTSTVETSVSGIYHVEYSTVIDDTTYTFKLYVFVSTMSDELVLFFEDKKEGVIV